MFGFLGWAFLEGLCNVLIQIISPANLWLRFKTGLARERRAWGLGYQLRERARREERGEDWRCIWTTIGIPDDGCEPLDKSEATRVNITPGRDGGKYNSNKGLSKSRLPKYFQKLITDTTTFLLLYSAPQDHSIGDWVDGINKSPKIPNRASS